jgi:hypothetical protein
MGSDDNTDNQAGNSDDGKPATVNFFNASSYTVDIYKNFNPENPDPNTLVCTIRPGQIKKNTIYPSADEVIGDTFYIRFKILLADSLATGSKDIHVDAKRDMSNISFVVEEGKSYTKTIEQPAPGQLEFIHGYIEITNTGSNQIQILKGDDILRKLDDNGAYLLNGSPKGYYEIPFTSFDTTLNVSLKAFDGGSTINFPAQNIERGKIYSFTCNDSNAVFTGVRSISVN